MLILIGMVLFQHYHLNTERLEFLLGNVVDPCLGADPDAGTGARALFSAVPPVAIS